MACVHIRFFLLSCATVASAVLVDDATETVVHSLAADATEKHTHSKAGNASDSLIQLVVNDTAKDDPKINVAATAPAVIDNDKNTVGKVNLISAVPNKPPVLSVVKKTVGAKVAAKTNTISHGSAVHDSVDAVHAAAKVQVDKKSLFLAYFVSLTVMILFVTAMFYKQGAAVTIQVIIYVCCLAFIKIVMKLVFETGFHFPRFMTALHLLASSAAAFVVLLKKKLVDGTPIAIPDKDEFLYGILPVALTFGLSIGSENSALVFVSASFSEVVASTNPVASAFLTKAFGMELDNMLLLPIAVVVGGCAISVSGEMHFSAVGFALLLAAVFFRGLKAVMQQKLLTGETKDKFDPVTLMAWTCAVAFVELAIHSCVVEGTAPVTALLANSYVGLWPALLGSCVIACTLNISALFVIRQLGAVGMQMVSQLKAILVVIGGIAILGESFTMWQKVGFAMALAGVYWYSDMKHRIAENKKKPAHEQEGYDEANPTTSSSWFNCGACFSVCQSSSN